MIKTEDFNKIYKTLSKVEKILLQTVAIIFEPSSKSTVSKCLRLYAEKINDHSLLQYIAIGTTIEKFIKQNLITTDFQCRPDILEHTVRKSILENQFDNIVSVVKKQLPLTSPTQTTPFSAERCVRDMRINIYSNRIDKFKVTYHILKESFPEYLIHKNPTLQIYNNPFDNEWFASLSKDLQTIGFYEISQHLCINLDKGETIFSSVTNFKDNILCINFVFNRVLLSGDIKKCEKIVNHLEKTPSYNIKLGCLSLLKNDLANAKKYFSYTSGEIFNPTTENLPPDFFSIFYYYIFILLTSDKQAVKHFLKHQNLVEANLSVDFFPCIQSLNVAAYVLLNQQNLATKTISALSKKNLKPFARLCFLIACYWADKKHLENKKDELTKLLKLSKDNSYYWPFCQLKHLLSKIYPNEYTLEDSDRKLLSLIDVVEPQSQWERSLKALTDFGHEAKSQFEQHFLTSRLSWHIDLETQAIIPKIQRIDNKNQWTAGRAINLKRLYNTMDELDFLSEQDKRIIRTIKQSIDKVYHYEKFEFDIHKAYQEIIGHPHLYLIEGHSPIELIKTQPELIAETVDENIHLYFPFTFSENDQIVVYQETQSRLLLIEVDSSLKQLYQLIGPDGLFVPLNEKNQVIKAISNLSSYLTIHSDFSDKDAKLTTLSANPTPILQIVPIGDQFKINFYVRPFKDAGPYLKPGKGGKNVFAEINKRRVQTRRNLEKETKLATTFLNTCPSISYIDSVHSDIFLDLETCLSFLEEAKSYDNDVILEWPEGKKINVTQSIGISNLALNIKKSNEWFQIDGALLLNENEVIKFNDLLTLFQKSNSNFIQIDEDQFIALTDELKHKIDELKQFTIQQDSDILFSISSTIMMEDILLDLPRLTTDPAWEEHINALRASENIVPNVPSTLQAELRDYQVDGFRWLVKLSNWKMGACLADDMGLGKTIQSIALILHRAHLGPTLIVAPTSVCFNWFNELKRFAPSLKVSQLETADRKKSIESQKECCVLIVTYGLLQLESEHIYQKRWVTTILDEAQAIKNPQTKRAKASYMIPSDFKFITTGTPIENHLGELWSIFHFINPGLLGTQTIFNEKYLIPIEKHQDHFVKIHLKKLIQPFILRRTKAEVLEELPPRTETTLHVELSPEEAHFYEALRRDCLQKIQTLTSQSNQNRIHILAAITKLRRAACHPQLIDTSLNIESAKLQLFNETILELLDSRHKVLVFSQFVDHLKIMEQYLIDNNISYQYLDGSTPVKQRQKRIDAFQNGEGDIFLISLKAGGFGLNLTAADYVIHLDPWWNPAVEDQASDRAHRIGQTRPVTIYRFITKNTIEEKILALHQRKRELADSLLSGTDVSTKVSLDDLLDLLEQQI